MEWMLREKERNCSSNTSNKKDSCIKDSRSIASSNGPPLSRGIFLEKATHLESLFNAKDWWNLALNQQVSQNFLLDAKSKMGKDC